MRDDGGGVDKYEMEERFELVSGDGNRVYDLMRLSDSGMVWTRDRCTKDIHLRYCGLGTFVFVVVGIIALLWTSGLGIIRYITKKNCYAAPTLLLSQTLVSV